MQNSAPKQRKEDAYHVRSKEYVRCGIQRFRRAPRPAVRSAGHNSRRRSRPAQQQAGKSVCQKACPAQIQSDFTALQIALTEDLFMQITLPSPRAGAKQSVELQITFAKPTYRSRSSFAEFFLTVPQNGEENVKQTLSESNRQLPAPQGRNRQTAEKNMTQFLHDTPTKKESTCRTKQISLWIYPALRGGQAFIRKHVLKTSLRRN